MIDLGIDNKVEEIQPEEVVDKPDLEDSALDSAKEDASQNIPETSDFLNWYTLRVVSGKEKFVKENIFRELEFSPEIKSKINEIFVPFEKIVVIKM